MNYLNFVQKMIKYQIMKKIKLPIKNIETNIILNALIQFKNDKLKQGIYTEPIDELILKLNKIY